MLQIGKVLIYKGPLPASFSFIFVFSENYYLILTVSSMTEIPLHPKLITNFYLFFFYCLI